MVQFIHCESKLFVSLVSAMAPVASAVELIRYMPWAEGHVKLALFSTAPWARGAILKFFAAPLNSRRVIDDVLDAAPRFFVSTYTVKLVLTCAWAGAVMVER